MARSNRQLQDKSHLTVKELSDYLGIGRNAAYKLTRRDNFPCIRVGNRIIIPADLFKDWLKNSVKNNWW